MQNLPRFKIPHVGNFHSKITVVFSLFLLVVLASCSPKTQLSGVDSRRNVIFIHPDGTSPSFFHAARFLHYGPDGTLHWDKLPYTAVYKGHMKNNLTGSSNGGAVTHAIGVKVHENSFGLDENGVTVVARSGKPLTLLEEARQAGFAVGIINSGSITEPGTGAFATRAENRDNHEEIARQIIMREAGNDIQVVLGGGEVWFLPKDVAGFHGSYGQRTDGLNLIEEAKERGFTIVYTLEQLKNLPSETQKVLGLFAAWDTYNDDKDDAPVRHIYTEEQLAAEGLTDFLPGTPTLAQMTEIAIKILSRSSAKGFYLVVEEEGADNFSNSALNARGAIEATKRADDAIGVALQFANNHNNTLVITASDSEASGLSVIGNPRLDNQGNVVPTREFRRLDGSVYFIEHRDGKNGTLTPPFISAPDRNNQRWPFAIAWSTGGDHSGNVVARAFGYRANMLRGTIDNTEIYRIKYKALFGILLD
ncbi:MAG TPA: alkaline phosphatase [Bacteroidales bacterium]|nr:alkaline phosphatase [Bacteroidales bacterium]